jgi:hypothetical protein
LSYFEHPAGSKNRIKILNALMKIGNSYPYEIKKFLDDEAKNLVENQLSSAFLSASKKKELIKKETISERTIFGWLGRLKKQGIVIHEDNKYRLSSQVASDVDFMAGLFGLNVFLSAMWERSDDKNLSDRLFQVINSFGVSIVYILLYCLQPLQNTNYNYDKTELEDFRKRWVDTAINPEHMLTLLRDQLGLLKIDSGSKSHRKMEFEELGQINHEKLVHSLEVKYPNLFNRINQGVEDLYKMITSKAGDGA